MQRMAIALGIIAGCMCLVACTTTAPHDKAKHVEQSSPKDTPLGEILRRFAYQRSLQDCKTKALSDADCDEAIARAEAHLHYVNERMELLLKNPKTNLCDMVRWSGACNNPLYTLGDLADCLQTSVDRGEALNEGRFHMDLDAKGCPTDRR